MKATERFGWDAATGKCLGTLSTGDPVSAAALTPDGRLAVARPRGIELWSMTPGPLISKSCRLDAAMKFAGETSPPGYFRRTYAGS